MSRRPEHKAPPQLYYAGEEAKKYHKSSRVKLIQRRMTERALELLMLPADQQCLILDVGCGSGLSGEVLEERGHTWVGTDISDSMLAVAKQREFDAANDDEDEEDDDDDEDVVPASEDEPSEEEEEEQQQKVGQKRRVRFDQEEEDDDDDDDEGEEGRTGGGPKPCEVIQSDMGDGVPFRPGVFDGAISISAIQWLCNIDKKGHIPQRRLKRLFTTLYNSLRRGARAVLQFYPENAQQLDMITRQAMTSGFGGGVVVDFPHSTRAKKHYLVLYAGLATGGYQPPKPLLQEDWIDEADSQDDDEEDHDDEAEEEERTNAKVSRRQRPHQSNRQHKLGQRKRKRMRGEKLTESRPATGTKDWVLMKKEERRKRGFETTANTKYTLRKRRPKF